MIWYDCDVNYVIRCKYDYGTNEHGIYDEMHDWDENELCMHVHPWHMHTIMNHCMVAAGTVSLKSEKWQR